VEQNANISYEEALELLKEQFLANTDLKEFVLPADKSKDGNEVKKSFMGISMNYDAQGTQLGAGKAYLDGDKEIARKDLTIVFM
jgi:UTP-glucose-1-phosphate uridylyltransferase